MKVALSAGHIEALKLLGISGSCAFAGYLISTEQPFQVFGAMLIYATLSVWILRRAYLQPKIKIEQDVNRFI